MAFQFKYKPLDYATAQKQVSKQVDPVYKQAVQNVQAQKYQNDIQSGQVAANRGLARSGLAADSLNKNAIAAQGQIGSLNADRSSQIAQMAQSLVNRDQDVSMQKRSQAYNEYMGQQNFNYQKLRDSVGDGQWNKQFDYQKSRDSVGDSQWNKQFDFNKQSQADDKAWRQYQFNNMSASEKAQLAWTKQQYGEDAAWRMYELQYNGNLQKGMNDAELEFYKSQGFQEP